MDNVQNCVPYSHVQEFKSIVKIHYGYIDVFSVFLHRVARYNPGHVTFM
jgi:hypothetical protein